MDVVDLLPDHPQAPERKCLEAFLPHLVNRSIRVRLLQQEASAASKLDDSSRRKTLQRTAKASDVSVTRIDYEVEVFWHDYIGNQLTGPIVRQVT